MSELILFCIGIVSGYGLHWIVNFIRGQRHVHFWEITGVVSTYHGNFSEVHERCPCGKTRTRELNGEWTKEQLEI